MVALELVHSDARGQIYSISLPGDREIMLLFSRKGTLRGGHSHSVPEDVIVLSGKMAYYKLMPLDGTNGVEGLVGGDISHNAPDQIHMGEFLEDTWLLEVKHAKKGEWTQSEYEPWRAKVRATA